MLYFEIGAETGILGLGLFCTITGVTLARLWSRRRRWAEERPDLAALAASLWLAVIAYLGTGMFLSLAYQRYWWVLLALAGAATQILGASAGRLTPVERPA
jgi:O-antigen ligase